MRFNIIFRVPLNHISSYELDQITNSIQKYFLLGEKTFISSDSSPLSLGHYSHRPIINFSEYIVEEGILQDQVVVYERKTRMKRGKTKDIFGFEEIEFFDIYDVTVRLKLVSEIITFNPEDSRRIKDFLKKETLNIPVRQLNKSNFDPGRYEDLLYITAVSKNNIDSKMKEIAYYSRFFNFYNISNDDYV